MSSTLTLYRPSARARTLAPSTSAWAPRGLAPYRTKRRVGSGEPAQDGCVAMTMVDAKSRTCEAIGTSRISSRSESTVDPLITRLTVTCRDRVVRSMIAFSSSSAGYRTRSLKRNRSSCASGSGYVPSISIGFCVASTKKGAGSGREAPPTVTAPSCIPSSSADWVFGVARLISSARRMWAKIGPCWNWKCFRPSTSSTMMFVPMMSAGIRSGVNWIRENDSSRPSERLDEQRLAETRHAFEEDVTAGEHGGQDVGDDLAVADDDLLDLRPQRLERGDERFHPSVLSHSGLLSRTITPTSPLKTPNHPSGFPAKPLKLAATSPDVDTECRRAGAAASRRPLTPS